MKRKCLLVLIILSVLSLLFTSTVLGANICTVNFSVNNNTPQRGGEVEVTISVKDIVEPISGVLVTFEYDSNNFELPTIEGLNGWDSSKVVEEGGIALAIAAPNYKATTTAGDIHRLKFKVKSNATLGDTKISLKKIEISKDDGTSVDVDAIDTTITIKEGENKQDENKEDENKQDENKQDENKQDENKQDENKQDENKQSENKQNENKQSEQKTNESNNQNIKTINASEDKTKASNTLPKTGMTKFAIVSVIALFAIIAVIFYRMYRKYNGI